MKRNPFIALCDYASRANWCWKICCTTCGHSAFKISFAKIIKDQHPDDESFWPHGKENHNQLKEISQYRDFINQANLESQIKLASIVAKADLLEIQSIVKFPDWLGYIGLVIYHCPNHEAIKIISDSFLPQFTKIVKNDKKVYEYLKEKQTKQELLNINDLNIIENSLSQTTIK